MNLSAPFIKRPVMTTLIMVVIVFFGVYAYHLLPVSDLPNIEYPTITVSAAQPGGSPSYMANLVTRPLERNLAAVSGIHTMTSSSAEGRSFITLHFNLDENLDQKEVEVQSAITKALPELPPLPYNPVFERISPADSPILFILLSSQTASSAELYHYAYHVLGQPFSMLDGVAQAEIYGIEYALRVRTDPLRMASHQIDFNELAGALTRANPNLPAGKIRGKTGNYLIEAYGQTSDPQILNSVIVKQINQSPLFVGDFAEVIESTKSSYPFFKLYEKAEPQNMAIVGIIRLPTSNTIAITKEIAKQLPKLQKEIPAAIDVKIFFSQADQIVHAFYDVEITLVIAFALVILVIFLYLGNLFEAFIPSLVLPLSMICTCIFMYLFGFNLDYLSLLALTLSIGFVIDDAIVVMENITRYVEHGKSPREAAFEGSKQISLTVLTMSVALSAVFIPFVFMPGIIGRMLKEFSVTIIVAIYCSGFISLILNPMLCSQFLKLSVKQGKSLSQKWHEKTLNFYMSLLDRSLSWKKSTLCLGFLTILGSLFLLKVLPIDFFPPSNLDLIQGLILCDEGSSKLHTNQLGNQVMQKLNNYPYIQSAAIASGYPTGDDQARFYVKLTSSHRPSTSAIARQLMKDLSQVAGVSVFARPYPMINLSIGADGSLGDYQYLLFSLDEKELYPAAKKLIAQLSQLPELVGVNSNMRQNTPQLRVHIDRERAGLYNISALDIESTLQYAYAGGRLSTFSKGVDLHDLIIETDPRYDLLTDDLDLLYIKSKQLPTNQALLTPSLSQTMVPLNSLASWTTSVGPATISHFNTFPSVTISFSLANHVALGTALTKIEKIAAKVLPSSVIASVQGTGEVFQQTFRSMGWLTLIAIFTIYILLGILYENFLHPLTILSALPLAIFGGLLTLWVCSQSLSLYAFVGLIVLIGLVQKNGIMLVDFALNVMKTEKVSPLEAIKQASQERFRPIMMTTIAAIAGAIPIAIGVGKYGAATRSLGLVITGGLIFSQLVTLFVIPVVFLYIQRGSDFLLTRLFSKKDSTISH